MSAIPQWAARSPQTERKPARPDKPTPPPSRRVKPPRTDGHDLYSRQVTRVARTRDGVELQYTLRAATGSADGPRPRLALIHSLALDQHVWQPVAERLAADVDILTYDCRGHGSSGRPPGPYSLAQFADDLADLLDTVGWRTAAVAGASMGGSVAQAFATAHTERVLALGLVDTTAWYGPDAPQRWAERAEQAQARGLASLVDFQVTRWFSDEFREQHPEVVERNTRVFVANDIACYVATCHMLGAFDLRRAVAQLQVPTAVIVGEQDYATPVEMARALHQAIAGSSLHVLPATRHLSPLEQPDSIAHLLRALVDREPGIEVVGEAELPS
jgi:3-oxoadipate enol-lactonase